MPVRVHARTRVIVISATGELDVVSRALMDAAVNSSLAGSWRVVVVDLAGLAFLDAMGARPIHRLVSGLAADRLALIVNAGPRVQQTLGLLGLDAWVVPVEELPLASDEELRAMLEHG